MCTLGVFLHLSKAFDSLDHKILSAKLENIGVRGVPLKLYCNSLPSPFKSITKRVAQGSILAPILFVTYINDFIYASSKFTFIIYADDSNLSIADKSLNALHSNLRSEFFIYKYMVKIK